jgi:hypothetical protein
MPPYGSFQALASFRSEADGRASGQALGPIRKAVIDKPDVFGDDAGRRRVLVLPRVRAGRSIGRGRPVLRRQDVGGHVPRERRGRGGPSDPGTRRNAQGLREPLTTLSTQARYAAGVREILECWFDGRPIRREYLIVDGGKSAGIGAHSHTVGDATGAVGQAAGFELTVWRMEVFV